MDTGVAVIEFDGSITLGDGLNVLRESVQRALAAGTRGILLDFEGVSYIDSAGLGELVGSSRSAHAAGVPIKLVHLQKKVQGLMQITRLLTLFETYEDEDVAVQSFSQ